MSFDADNLFCTSQSSLTGREVYKTLPVNRNLPSEEVRKFLRCRQAELGLTNAQLAARMIEAGYEISTETVALWNRTGASHFAAVAAGADAIASAYEVPTVELLNVVQIERGHYIC